MGKTGRALLLGMTLTAGASIASATEFVVVVNEDLAGSRIRRSLLAEIYQKDVVRWGDQTRIKPIDQSLHAPVRRAFCREVLGRSIGEVQSFWRARLAEQREMPPKTRSSDEEVLEAVASQEGAIGYVRAGAELPPGVKVLTVID